MFCYRDDGHEYHTGFGFQGRSVAGHVTECKAKRYGAKGETTSKPNGNLTSQFKTKLKELLEEYKNVISLDSMGFPKGWEEEKCGKIEK